MIFRMGTAQWLAQISHTTSYWHLWGTVLWTRKLGLSDIATFISNYILKAQITRNNWQKPHLHCQKHHDQNPYKPWLESFHQTYATNLHHFDLLHPIDKAICLFKQSDWLQMSDPTQESTAIRSTENMYQDWDHFAGNNHRLHLANSMTHCCPFHRENSGRYGLQCLELRQCLMKFAAISSIPCR
jgi:hypothetical protein